MKCVSVIVLNYNGESFIAKLLTSLANQTFKNFTTIFVDNASTDQSLNILKENLGRAYIKNLTVRIVLSKRNMGYCKGNNMGLKYAQGEYIVFLNNDTYVSPTWLNELVSILDKHPTIGSCQSKILYADTGAIQTVGNNYDAYATQCRPHFNVDEGKDILFSNFFYPSGTSMIVRRKALERGGAFDDKLFFGDSDLGWRLRLLGYGIGAALKSICYHYGSHSTKQLFPALTIYFHEHKDRIRILIKNYSCSNLIIRLPLSLSLTFSESLFRTLSSKRLYMYSWFKAVLWNLVNLKDTVKRRIEVQSLRVVSDNEIEKYMSNYVSVIRDDFREKKMKCGVKKKRC